METTGTARETAISPIPGQLPVNSGFKLKQIDIAAAVLLLESFYEEDEAEQRETWQSLQRVLAEERP